MVLYKHSVLTIFLVFHSFLCLASIPNQIELNGIVYSKAQENVFGDHKSSQYVQNGQTLSNWTSMVSVHAFINNRDPIEFAQSKFGTNSSIELINNNKNDIIQSFDTMNSIGKSGDPVIFQQNIWRYKKLNLGKGIIAIEYTQQQLFPNQATPGATEKINPQIKEDIKSLPIERYEF